MSRLIPLGDRAYVDPDHIKFVQWSVPRNPPADTKTGDLMLGAVTVETYHKSYRVLTRTIEEAQTIVNTIVAEIGVRELDRLSSAKLSPSLPMMRQTR